MGDHALPDSFGHGTHIAETIGAAADNVFGGIGIVPEVALVLVKMLFDSGSGTPEDVIEGIPSTPLTLTPT